MCNGCTTVRSDSATQEEMSSQKEQSSLQEQSTSFDVLTPQRRSSRRKNKASSNKNTPDEDASEHVVTEPVKTTEDAISAVAETVATTAVDNCKCKQSSTNNTLNTTNIVANVLISIIRMISSLLRDNVIYIQKIDRLM